MVMAGIKPGYIFTWAVVESWQPPEEVTFNLNHSTDKEKKTK